jgi:hypothetical protein
MGARLKPMLALTERQEEIIRDFEAASAFCAQNGGSACSKLLSERAGYPPQTVYHLMEALARDEKIEGLKRLKGAFDRAGVKTRKLDMLVGTEISVAKPEELKLQSESVPTPAPEAPKEDEFQVEVEVYMELLQALRRIKDKRRQTHLLTCVRLFYGLNV